MEKKKFGLIGEKLSHSYSPFVHERFGNYEYKKYELSPEELDTFFDDPNLGGVNVTIPYKQAVMKYCDEISDVARKIGCVNTIVNNNGKLYGDNTDYYGLQEAMSMNGITVKGKKVLVLGTGATSLTAETFCNDGGAAEIIKVSRSGEINYDNVYSHNDAEIIINTTPAGMYPENNVRLIDLSRFSNLSGVMDVVPNPLKTRLILQAEELSLKCGGGLYMLVCQAKKGAELFSGKPVPDILVYDTIRNLIEINRNIVLIGMPGCGKSLIGKMLSEKKKKKFIDIDAEIEKLEGKTIPEIFSQDGAAYFRKAEALQIEKYSKEHDLIIATGGGAVLDKENMLNLKQNGILFYLKRDIDKLEMTNRPLSKDKESLNALFLERKELYEGYADETVSNNFDPESALSEIIQNL